jgi:hypothetical protein
VITITIWHNIAHDGEGRHIAMLDGYQPGDPMVRVFTYQADPAGRPPEEIADEAFDTFNDHPRDPDGADLARAYYRRRLRSLSFPGKRTCSARECCLHHGPVLPGSPWTSARWRDRCGGLWSIGMRVRPAALPR